MTLLINVEINCSGEEVDEKVDEIVFIKRVYERLRDSMEKLFEYIEE